MAITAHLWLAVAGIATAAAKFVRRPDASDRYVIVLTITPRSRKGAASSRCRRLSPAATRCMRARRLRGAIVEQPDHRLAHHLVLLALFTAGLIRGSAATCALRAGPIHGRLLGSTSTHIR